MLQPVTVIEHLLGASADRKGFDYLGNNLRDYIENIGGWQPTRVGGG